MTVTKRVGYRYLWVDKYCINQQRKEDVAEQVGKMDLIYQNAKLTIIAATKDDPSYGLPREMHKQDMQGFKSVFCADNHVGMFPKGVGSTHLDVFRRIEEYSKRSLGNAFDILKGMLGIFNAFERSRLGIKQYSGIPILPSMPAKSKSIKAWTPAMGFLALGCSGIWKNGQRDDLDFRAGRGLAGMGQSPGLIITGRYSKLIQMLKSVSS
ncbi:hypothetical protein IFR05_005525 [Cadophora sp. M221]|nr:hypothetical protein IFR05_005525 [Cadophora sp. M221]